MESESSRPADAAVGEPQLPTPAQATATSQDKAALPTTSSSSLAGSKRSAPSLLPPFEPLSSSPALPRPLKRQNLGHDAHLKYPTPVPTSSTGILSSSPLRRPQLARKPSERVPLGSVPSVELAENGEILIMGRSSNSSHFQLSANRLISRVHVKARYIPAPGPLQSNKIEIICNGWNGLKLHCQGRSWELFKGDTFTSETEGTEVMVDVQDARVLIQWPRRTSPTDNISALSDSSWDDSPPRSQTRPGPLLQSSPLRRPARIQSPESPTPATMSSSQRLQSLLPSPRDRDSAIEIYEDEPELPGQENNGGVDVGVSMCTEATASFSSSLSELDEEDPDEENDPVVHSFGPFGADISNRFASILSKSPRVVKPPRAENPEASDTHTEESSLPSDPPSPNKKPAEEVDESDAAAQIEQQLEREQTPKPKPVELSGPPKAELYPEVSNHVVNQLAFSRLSSTPLSAILQNLPGEQKHDMTADLLREIIESTTCIGTIERQGKDAAGKALESQYYYVPETDTDENRRAAVVDGLRKPSLRNCRKQHKQYYWKRPRTP
ncbi:target of SBF [Lecanicillium sp. MT-2017a]|nr:target of SBF [Lecanicillium sp. MT-2017a]